MPSTSDRAPRPRDARKDDLGWMLALNRVHEIELSPLTEQSLAALVDGALHATVIDDRAAFLVTFAQDADYDSPNFAWFRDRYARFAYVDRIAVDAAHRGRGLARLLYEDFFERARDLGHDTVTCEVNAVPPNPASDAFHASLGFEVVGEAELPGRGKIVRYLRKTL